MKKKAILAVALALLLALCGCGSSGLTSFTTEETEAIFTMGDAACSAAEARLLLLQYQKENTSLYGVDLWSEEAGATEALTAYLKDLALSELAQIYTLSLLAEEWEVSLTEEERALAKSEAYEYWNSLSKEEQAYTEADEEILYDFYERYALAQAVYQAIIADVSMEVSDDEARVISALQICVADKAQARALYEKLEAGASFSSLAASYNEAEETEVTLSRSSLSDEATAAVFALAEEEYTTVLALDGGYYLFYCTTYYNEALTEENKENVLAERISQALAEASAASEALSGVLCEDVWEAVTLYAES